MEKKCTEAVMESTGSYWKPVFTSRYNDLAATAPPTNDRALKKDLADSPDRLTAMSISYHGWFNAFVITSTVEETTFDSDEATFESNEITFDPEETAFESSETTVSSKVTTFKSNVTTFDPDEAWFIPHDVVDKS